LNDLSPPLTEKFFNLLGVLGEKSKKIFKIFYKKNWKIFPQKISGYAADKDQKWVKIETY